MQIGEFIISPFNETDTAFTIAFVFDYKHHILELLPNKPGAILMPFKWLNHGKNIFGSFSFKRDTFTIDYTVFKIVMPKRQNRYLATTLLYNSRGGEALND